MIPINWLLSPLPGWLDWLRYILWPLFAVAAVLVTFFTFSLVANLVASPFNGLLAERKAPGDGVLAYVCSGTSCSAPVKALADLEPQLQPLEARATIEWQ